MKDYSHSPSLFDSARARWSDPQTSREAASRVTQDKLTQTQERILHLVRMHGPLTDEALIDLYRHIWPESKTSEQSIRSRRSELSRRGLLLIVPDKQGVTKLGGKCRIWRAAA
jgi:hypothetical protein